MAGKRQLELWGEDTPETAEQQSNQLSHTRAEVGKAVRQLFVNPDRQVQYKGASPADWPEPDHDRNTITVDRIRDDLDGPGHRFIIKRHDYVEVFFSKNKVDYGTVVGISHAREEVRVSFGEGQEGIWFAVGCIYPAVPPNKSKNDSEARSREIKELCSIDSQQQVKERIDRMRKYTPVKTMKLVVTGAVDGQYKLVSTKEAMAFFKQYWKDCPANDQERFVVACCDTKHKVQCVVTITVGTLDASLVHPREVFKPAFLQGSSAVVLSHNHPSGDATPSREDHQVTDQLTEAGKLLGINVLDHIIHGDGTNEVISIREQR